MSFSRKLIFGLILGVFASPAVAGMSQVFDGGNSQNDTSFNFAVSSTNPSTVGSSGNQTSGPGVFLPDFFGNRFTRIGLRRSPVFPLFDNGGNMTSFGSFGVFGKPFRGNRRRIGGGIGNSTTDGSASVNDTQANTAGDPPSGGGGSGGGSQGGGGSGAGGSGSPQPSAVPEPGTMALWGLAAFGLFAITRKRQS